MNEMKLKKWTYPPWITPFTFLYIGNILVYLKETVLAEEKMMFISEELKHILILSYLAAVKQFE